MEQQKLNFTTHEVNDLIGEVPQQVLRICLAIMLAIIASVGIMLCVIPYPANVSVASKQFYFDTGARQATGLPGKYYQQLHCKLILKDNQFNNYYLARFAGAAIIVHLDDKEYTLHCSSSSTVRKDSCLVADIAIKNDRMLQMYYQDEDRGDTTDQAVELINENFTIKDRLCASLNTLLKKED